MNHSKSKRKKYFSSNLMAKKNRDLFLKAGIKGFVCTCNGNEKQCIRESYNILNEYADQLYGEEQLKKAAEPDESKSAASVEDDVMDAFQKEVDAMKTQTAEKTRRFQARNTDIINCIFVETTLEDPVGLLHHVMSDLFETKQKKVRFLLRMVPVEATCRAFLDELEKTADSLFDKYFTKEPTTYAVMFNKRGNSALERDAAIEKLAAIVQKKNKEHKVNLNNPNLTIIVEVMRRICGIAVVQDYYRFGKFNLHVVCGIDKTEIENAIGAEKAEDPSGDGKAADKTENDSNNSEATGEAEDFSDGHKADVENAQGNSSATDETISLSEKKVKTDEVESSGDCPAASKIESCDSTTVGDADTVQQSK